MNLEASELILNPSGSIYHLDLLPQQIADTVITVGDQDRVSRITRHFDRIEYQVQKREFHTQTGYYKGKRISVISTGIGPDNIDIVLNELDALVNIDLETRSLKEKPKSLDLIRLGTSGSIQPGIPVDSLLISHMALGLDGLMHFYQSQALQEPIFASAFIDQLQWDQDKATPYFIPASQQLLDRFSGAGIYQGITATNLGFYAPQGRSLRLPLKDQAMKERIARFAFQGHQITNLEMETAAIYGLGRLLGHRTLSLNAIIANRATGEFSKDPEALVEKLIHYALEKLVSPGF